MQSPGRVLVLLLNVLPFTLGYMAFSCYTNASMNIRTKWNALSNLNLTAETCKDGEISYFYHSCFVVEQDSAISLKCADQKDVQQLNELCDIFNWPSSTKLKYSCTFDRNGVFGERNVDQKVACCCRSRDCNGIDMIKYLVKNRKQENQLVNLLKLVGLVGAVLLIFFVEGLVEGRLFVYCRRKGPDEEHATNEQSATVNNASLEDHIRRSSETSEHTPTMGKALSNTKVVSAKEITAIASSNSRQKKEKKKQDAKQAALSAHRGVESKESKGSARNKSSDPKGGKEPHVKASTRSKHHTKSASELKVVATQEQDQ